MTKPNLFHNNVPGWVDEEAIQGLKNLMEEEFPSLIRNYLQMSERYLRQMDEAVAVDDPETLVRSAHSLKSTSLQLGLSHLFHHARALENNPGCMNRDALISALKEDFQEARPFLESLVQPPAMMH